MEERLYAALSGKNRRQKRGTGTTAPAVTFAMASDAPSDQDKRLVIHGVYANHDNGPTDSFSIIQGGTSVIFVDGDGSSSELDFGGKGPCFGQGDGDVAVTASKAAAATSEVNVVYEWV